MLPATPLQPKDWEYPGQLAACGGRGFLAWSPEDRTVLLSNPHAALEPPGGRGLQFRPKPAGACPVRIGSIRSKRTGSRRAWSISGSDNSIRSGNALGVRAERSQSDAGRARRDPEGGSMADGLPSRRPSESPARPAPTFDTGPTGPAADPDADRDGSCLDVKNGPARRHVAAGANERRGRIHG